MKANGDVDVRVHIFTAMAQRRVGWLMVCLDDFTLGEISWYSFYRRFE